MSVLVVSLIAAGISIALAIAGLLVVRRFVHIDNLKVNHEVAAVMVSVLGTLYAVLLGLIVVDALQQHERAEAKLEEEANALGMVLQLSRTLSMQQRMPFVEAELRYCDAAVNKEWKLQEQAKAPDHETIRAFGSLWQTTGRFAPTSAREQAVQSSMLSAMAQATDARRYRIIASKQHIPLLLWIVLIVGGVCIVSFTYFFGLESLKAQAVMTGVITFMLCLNFLLVYFYGRPYTGELQIQPDALKHLRNVLRKSPAAQNQEKGNSQRDSDDADDSPE